MAIAMFALALAASIDSCRVTRELRIATPDGRMIAAVLETADPSVRRPTVLLISGAGAWDRDYFTVVTTQGKQGAYRVMAARFLQLGFAVLRYDEAGTGASTGDYKMLATTASLATDVGTIVATLRSLAEVDEKRISLLGHSEGGAIAGLVGASDTGLGAIVMLAAPSRTGRRVMEYQRQVGPTKWTWGIGFTPESKRTYFDQEEARRLVGEAWYPFFLDYDPLPPMRRLKMPVLIVQGTDDWFVSPDQAGEIAKAVREGGNRDVILRRLKGHDHDFSDPAFDKFPPRLSLEMLHLVESWLSDKQSPQALPRTCGRSLLP